MLKREVYPSQFNLSKTFLIHDNGGKPFKVIINAKSVVVYKARYKDYIQNDYEKKPLLTIKNYTGVFIGTHMNNKFKGNTILVHLNNRKYIYIGEIIYIFETVEPIKHYVSEIGNSDVPYAYANTENKTYLMLPYQINKKDTYFYIEKKNIIKKNPYHDFYYNIVQNPSKHDYKIRKVKILHNRHTYSK
jgi:hypothetical protein